MRELSRRVSRTPFIATPYGVYLLDAIVQTLSHPRQLIYPKVWKMFQTLHNLVSKAGSSFK